MKQLKYVTSLVAFMMLMFLGTTSFAQSGFTTANLLSDKQLSTEGIVLVDDATALEILLDQGKGLLGVATDTDLEEAVNSIKVDYFAYLSEVVNTGVGIKTALEGSANQLNSIMLRFNADTGVNALLIYTDTLNLLEQ
jgi:hypothetical protein